MHRFLTFGFVGTVSIASACAFAACVGSQAEDGSDTRLGTDGSFPSASGSSSSSASVGPAEPTSTHPRIVDTERMRLVTPESLEDTRLQAEARLLHPQVKPANFTITTGAPVVGAAGVFGANFSIESSSDQLFFGVQAAPGTGVGITSSAVCTGACTSNNFFALSNIYTATPTLNWSAGLAGGFTASVALSADGSRLYLMSDSGTLYCLNASGGTTCSSWMNPTITISGKGLTPWVDSYYNSVYVHDGSGNLYNFNATTGTQLWMYPFSSSPSRATPAEVGLVIYIGDGSSKLYRIVDGYPVDAGAPTSASSISLDYSVNTTGTNTNCSGGSSIDNSVSVDVNAGKVFIPWKGCIYALPHYCSTGCSITSGSWAVTASGWTGSSPTTTLQTYPTIDGSYVYWAIPGVPGGATPVSAVWKTPYAITSVQGTTLVNATSTDAGATVTAAPVVYNGNLFVGDTHGYVEEFGCASSKSSSVSFLAETSQAVGVVNSPIVFDNTSGNIEYGFGSTITDGGTVNGLVQFPLWESSPASNFNWNCPSGMVACDSQNCGTGPTSTQCVPTAACATGAVCTSLADAGDNVALGVAAAEGNTVVGVDGGAVCPPGNVILGVLGASYGLPPATPDDPVSGSTFDFSTTCNATDSLAVTQSKCALNSSQTCSVVGNNSTFGDPCVGTSKHFYAWFACGTQVGDGGTSSLPTFCSRQNVTPAGSASDSCQANPDGGVATCQGTCLSGWGDCNSNLQYDGCETYLLGSDISNCGACGNLCPAVANGTPVCSSGTCTITCNSGYAVCGGQCLPSSDYLTDSNNCGSCGNICPGGAACSGGVCGAPTTACTSAAGSVYYAYASENAIITGSQNGNTTICPTGTVIQAIVGASYGTPITSADSVNNGTTFQYSTTCHSDNSLPDTKVYCPLNTSSNCSSGFYAENGIFVDPCYGTGKHYDGWFVCAAATDAGAGSSPYYCSRQNLTFTGSDPCTTPSDGGTAACKGTCMMHFADCNANLQSDGCEADLLIDPNNCGTCNNVCMGSTPACVSGTCVE